MSQTLQHAPGCEHATSGEMSPMELRQVQFLAAIEGWHSRGHSRNEIARAMRKDASRVSRWFNWQELPAAETVFNCQALGTLPRNLALELPSLEPASPEDLDADGDGTPSTHADRAVLAHRVAAIAAKLEGNADAIAVWRELVKVGAAGEEASRHPKDEEPGID